MFPCFVSFLDIFQGYPFNYRKYDAQSLYFLDKMFGLSFLIELIPIPVIKNPTLQNAIEFFLSSVSPSSQRQFYDMVDLVAQNLENVQFEYLDQLPNVILDCIFSSKILHIPSEDYLFDLIFNLASKDTSRVFLFKNIFFPGVSSQRMRSFLDNFHFEDIHSDIFESLKQRLFCDSLLPIFPFNRWTSQTNHLLHSDVQEIFHLLRKFENNKNPVEIVKNLILKNQGLQKDVKRLEALSSGGISIDYKTGNNQGIIHHIKNQSGVILNVDCSSSIIFFPFENVLKDDHLQWISENHENSWIRFHFPNHKLLLSGYLLRSCKNSIYPKNWKLEGSFDFLNWYLIDARSNQNVLKGQYTEKHFLCQETTSFPIFQFTQLGNNNIGNFSFSLTLCEFFGKFSSIK